MKDLQKKREDEKQLVREMVAMYCHRHHGSVRGQLCEDCQKLAKYAADRSDCCPFMEQKTYCSNCAVHCYEPPMRQRIKTVMAFSAPRLLLVHSVKALDYVIKVKWEKRRYVMDLQNARNKIVDRTVTKRRNQDGTVL